MNVHIGEISPSAFVEKSATPSTSSLERLVRARGPIFAGVNYGRKALKFQMWFGGVLTAAGGACLTLPLFGVDSHVMFAAIGPVIAGVTNLSVGAVMRHRFGGNQSQSVPLTDEAKAMVVALNRKFLGRRSAWYYENANFDGRYAGYYSHMGWMPEPPSISEEALQVLEKAAYQYNRVTALLLSAGGHPAIARISSKISSVADQALADILHQSGWLSKYPEGGAAMVQRIEAAIGEMTEMADRLEALASAEPTFTERLASRSGMCDVLDELRMEQSARAELTQKTEK